MKQIMWWTYGLTGEECRRLFPELKEDIEHYENITYIRRDNYGEYRYRYAEDDEEDERHFFEIRLMELDAEEQFIEGLVGVI